jgi:hypothetical protein
MMVEEWYSSFDGRPHRGSIRSNQQIVGDSPGKVECTEGGEARTVGPRHSLQLRVKLSVQEASQVSLAEHRGSTHIWPAVNEILLNPRKVLCIQCPHRSEKANKTSPTRLSRHELGKPMEQEKLVVGAISTKQLVRTLA